MADATTSRVSARGHGGIPPTVASALMENKRIAQARTTASIKIPNVRAFIEKKPKRIAKERSGRGTVGSTKIAGVEAAENIICASVGANMESRPEAAAAERIWMYIQSRK